MPPTVPRALATCLTLAVGLGVHTGAARTAAAQTASGGAPPLATGTRVRVTAVALGSGPQVASVLGQRGDTLVVRPTGTRDSVALPMHAISLLEVSGGRQSRAPDGVSLGFLVGAVGGALAGATNHGPFISRGGSTVLGGVVGGLLGGITGGVVSARWTAERWDRVQVAGRSAQLRIGPGGRGGVALALTF